MVCARTIRFPLSLGERPDSIPSQDSGRVAKRKRCAVNQLSLRIEITLGQTMQTQQQVFSSLLLGLPYSPTQRFRAGDVGKLHDANGTWVGMWEVSEAVAGRVS